MIPHKLRLRNFMCYRDEQSLDFSGIHLACLTGDNGHGKSTLLDAITWALWGKARARRDDELITLGESDMWVEFEFGLGPQRYRVWRQRSRKGRGQSDLHFYVWNAASEDWQLIDEGGLHQRQAQIDRILRMDYDTFTNSAFILQGRADSFTVKTPGERKQILSDILGLGRYDQYEERAKEETQRLKALAERIQGEATGIDRDLARRPEYERQLESARATVNTAGLALRAAEAEQNEIRGSLQNAQGRARQLEDLRRRMARSQRDLAEGHQQLGAAEARLGEYSTILEQRAEIEAGWSLLQATREADATWNRRLLAHTRLQEQVSKARMNLEQAKLSLETERRHLVERQTESQRRATAGKEQATALAEVQGILAHLSEQQTLRETLVVELREIAERAAELRSENDHYKSEGQAIRDKMALLTEGQVAACPLCGQGLTPDHRDEMLAAFTAEREDLLKRYRHNQDVLKALVERKTELDVLDTGLERELRALSARQRQAAQAEAVIAEGQLAVAEHLRLSELVVAVDQRLAQQDYAHEQRAELERLEVTLAESGYDSAAHKQVRDRLAELAGFDARYQRQLLPATEGIAGVRSQVEALRAQQARRAAELAEDEASSAQLAASLADLPSLQAALERATRVVEQAAGDERRARQEEGAALQQLSVLSTLEERRKQIMAELSRFNEEISLYNQLREAFGKKGLQAMIIESAIPEVEEEANRLLNRMTAGRMSLRLETQREKVTGGVAETLDIIISDELGARAYEMFSGGEGFRVNLSLRIAISKLLARRAGSQLQTLVIDEGFGTQDQQGRGLLVEAISSIQDDFERIIVITHIEELKDLFPARIDVVKTANGSRVSIA